MLLGVRARSIVITSIVTLGRQRLPDRWRSFLLELHQRLTGSAAPWQTLDRLRLRQHQSDREDRAAMPAATTATMVPRAGPGGAIGGKVIVI
jgi:hypothetical protein